jgi:membrane-anchored glycerophosphoryl diester phosphodiesterase (GDPDase)
MVSNENITLIVRILCLVIIVWIIIYLALIFTKGKCSSVATATLKGISGDERFKQKLRDFYIKTSYNSCSTGQFQNDWVNLCAL